MMYQLSSSQILEIWEKGSECTLMERALLILNIVLQDASYETLAQLTIGQRNVHLLLSYEQTFGSILNCFVKCSACSEPLEFPLNLKAFDLLLDSNSGEQSMVIDEYALHFRLINCADLIAAATQSTLENAKHLLLKRCLLSSSYNKQSIAVEELPDAIVDQFSDQLRKTDSQAEILLNLTCPTCNASWQEMFDIAEFFWEKIIFTAKQLLAEVHQLALAYGWQESAILAMSQARRQYYLERIS